MKALVISHNCFSNTRNNGKTLESFFSGFEKQDLSQLFFIPDDFIDFSFCDNYYLISDIDLLKSCLNSKNKCGGILKSTTAFSSKSKKLNTSKIKFSKKYLSLFRDILWGTGKWNTLELNLWCKEANPDFIFYVGGGFEFSHKIALFLSKYLSKPLVTYFTDDYLIYPHRKNFIDFIQHKRMACFYRRTVENSSLLFAIGELMAKEYSSYFDRVFFPIMNSVTVLPYVPYEKYNKIIISYFGGLHLERWKMLVRLAKLLPEDLNINLYSIFAPEENVMKEFDKVGIVYKGKLEGEALRMAILNTDVLLHVESDDKYYKSLTRLSVSTKISEYLVSGRFILGYGPEEVASLKLLSDNNIGVVMSSQMPDAKIRESLLSILSDFEYRKTIGLNGYKYAADHFDKEKIVENFMSKLNMLCLETRSC